DGGLRLLPLAMSVREMTRLAEKERGRGHDRPDRLDQWRVLVNGYEHDKSSGGLSYRAGSFLDRERPWSWSASHQEVWHADLRRARFHWRERNGREFCLGLDLDEADDALIRHETWELLPEDARKRYDPGILLVLGLDGSKATNLPDTKKHEVFLRFDPGSASSGGLDLPPGVVDEFCKLAENAARLARGGEAEDFPYLHLGRDRPPTPAGTEDWRRWRPRPGDLVYYEAGSEGVVQHIAYSAIWRLPVDGSLHRSVERVSRDLVPFHSGRSQVTLAERLFGFVEANGKRALAGRVRFSHGLVAGAREDGWYEPAVTLKILSTPKPPSPALYFGHHGHLGKGRLDLRSHHPQGRKVYLHHRDEDVEGGRYKTSEAASDPKAKLKMKVRPLKRGCAFFFHVDFHNLSRRELGYLLYALRPTPEFRHKLGLGKPLGLGRVRIDPLALCWIDRQACYRPAGVFAGKYAACDARRETSEWQEWVTVTGELATRYRHEREIAIGEGVRQGSWPSMDELAIAVRASIPEPVRTALELVGDPASTHLEVTYPVKLGQDAEGEHFRWFVANDKAKQALPPLQRRLPALHRLR
ncbi:MAG: TIGR03986 family type III CRISPR-associated RAMP protein, partial [Thermoanaerobaculia bacterium]